MTPAPAARIHPPTTTRLDALVDAVREAVGRGLSPDITAYLVAERLAPYLADKDLLTAGQRESDPSSYRRHLLHAEPDGSFSLISLVWLPGQRTGIHDHVAWCTTGVYEGEEHERRYRLVPAAPGAPAHLVATEDVVNTRGTVCGLAPPGDIHRVTNAGSGLAISLHVYGTDVSRLGSSIRREYDLPADR